MRARASLVLVGPLLATISGTTSPLGPPVAPEEVGPSSGNFGLALRRSQTKNLLRSKPADEVNHSHLREEDRHHETD